MNRFLIVSAFALSTVLIIPVAAQQGDDRAREQNQEKQKSYHDKQGKDDHVWNDNENRAYGVYQDQQHRQHTDFDKDKPSQQQAYFKWRHKNPDSTLFKIEIK